MSALSLAQLQALAASVGFPNPALAAAVAMAESGGNPDAYGDADYGGSIGLWQVNLPAHPDYSEQDLYDPTYNAKAALAISSNGKNWNPWTTYRTGAYKKWYAGPLSGKGGLLPMALLLGGGGYLTRNYWLPLLEDLMRKLGV